MGYTVDYKQFLPHERDAMAIRDAADYLGLKAYGLVVEMLSKAKTAKDIQYINLALGFAGCVGLPFHALCRKYAPDAYKLWLDDTEPGIWND